MSKVFFEILVSYLFFLKKKHDGLCNGCITKNLCFIYLSVYILLSLEDVNNISIKYINTII